MQAAQLFQHFKDNAITLDEVAQRTGYNLVYVINMLHGHEPLNDRAKFRFIESYPETADFLLNGGDGREASGERVKA